MTVGSHQNEAALGGPSLTARLGRVLDQQTELYQRLDALAQQQSSHIDQGEAEQLIGVLAQRQIVIDEIARLNEELRPVQERWSATADEVSEDERQQIRRRTEALSELIHSIGRRDEADRARLERHRDAVRGEIRKSNQAKSAAAAYGGPRGPVSPRYQDRDA
ncbi:MAG: flagellar export chaperone FlgN [Planctomycetota bacterium]